MNAVSVKDAPSAIPPLQQNAAPTSSEADSAAALDFSELLAGLRLAEECIASAPDPAVRIRNGVAVQRADVGAHQDVADGDEEEIGLPSSFIAPFLTEFRSVQVASRCAQAGAVEGGQAIGADRARATAMETQPTQAGDSAAVPVEASATIPGLPVEVRLPDGAPATLLQEAVVPARQAPPVNPVSPICSATSPHRQTLMRAWTEVYRAGLDATRIAVTKDVSERALETGHGAAASNAEAGVELMPDAMTASSAITARQRVIAAQPRAIAPAPDMIAVAPGIITAAPDAMSAPPETIVPRNEAGVSDDAGEASAAVSRTNAGSPPEDGVDPSRPASLEGAPMIAPPQVGAILRASTEAASGGRSVDTVPDSTVTHLAPGVPMASPPGLTVDMERAGMGRSAIRRAATLERTGSSRRFEQDEPDFLRQARAQLARALGSEVGAAVPSPTNLTSARASGRADPDVWPDRRDPWLADAGPLLGRQRAVGDVVGLAAPADVGGRFDREASALVAPRVDHDPTPAAPVLAAREAPLPVETRVDAPAGSTLIRTAWEELEPPGQIVRAIRMQWREGSGEARLRLHPEHLGSVTIDLKVEGANVSATLRTQNASAFEWIASHQTELRQALTEQGLNLERFDVAHEETPSSADGGGQRQGERQARPRPRRRLDEPRFDVVV